MADSLVVNCHRMVVKWSTDFDIGYTVLEVFHLPLQKVCILDT